MNVRKIADSGLRSNTDFRGGCLKPLAVLLPVVLILLLPLSLEAQSGVWPPEAITPAPIMQTLSLADARIVPSTRRWNLVWADQLRPYLFSPAQISFAARHYIGSQKLWADQAGQFRAHDPNFLMLIYHLAAGLNPARNDDCPDPKTLTGDGHIGVVAPEGYVSEWENNFLPWLQSEGIAPGSARFEEMFQHYDVTDAAHRVWHLDPYWLMNLDNADWRRYVSETCENWMEGNENEGCFFDVAVETNAFFYNPRKQNPRPGNFDWWADPHHPAQNAGVFADRRAFADWMNTQYREYFQAIYRDFHSSRPQRLVIPNVDQMVTSVYDPVWLDGDAGGETVDGVMIEGFGNYYDNDMYLTLERCVRHVTGRGKILIAQFHDDTPVELYRRTAMYMLVKNENSYINVVAADMRWYPEYEIDLGDQLPLPATLEQLRINGSGTAGLWRRDYTRGMVLVNTSNAAVPYMLPAGRDWELVRTSVGGSVAENGAPATQSLTYEPVSWNISIPSNGGVMLRAREPTAISSMSPVEMMVDLYPQPASDELCVTVGTIAGRTCSVQLSDLLGRVQRRRVLTESSTATDSPVLQQLRLPLHGLPAGCYLLSVIQDGQMPVLRNVIVRPR